MLEQTWKNIFFIQYINKSTSHDQDNRTSKLFIYILLERIKRG